MPAASLATPQPVKKATAAQVKPKKKITTTASSGADRLKVGTLGSFTPAVIDPDRAATAPAPGRAAGAAPRAQVQERSFRFTPSGKGGDRKAFTVGVTSRVVKPAVETAARDDAFPTAGYNFDLAVGYQGFSVSGGYSRLDNGILAAREGVDLGLSYRGRRWKTTLQLGTEHGVDGRPNPLGLDRRYSVELGGAYALSPRLSLSGGVRYQLMRDDALGRGLTSQGGEDGAVFLGTAFTF